MSVEEHEWPLIPKCRQVFLVVYPRTANVDQPLFIFFFSQAIGLLDNSLADP